VKLCFLQRRLGLALLIGAILKMKMVNEVLVAVENLGFDVDSVESSNVPLDAADESRQFIIVDSGSL
jgi:hypothetical protein